MPLLVGGSDYELFAHSPESLEGRLLFAVPKSESAISAARVQQTELMGQLQRAGYSNQL